MVAIFWIISIVMGILLAIVGGVVMRDTSFDMSHMVAGSPSEGMPWILLIGIVVAAAGLAGLWRASGKRAE